MKMSKLFVQTLREYPSDAEVISHKLLVRAGYIRKLTSGVYNYLPLMWRVLKKIENIVREEMDNAGAQELLMPFVQPKELWEESGRWDVYGKELMRLRDRHNREMCLGRMKKLLLLLRVTDSNHTNNCLLIYIKFNQNSAMKFVLVLVC